MGLKNVVPLASSSILSSATQKLRPPIAPHRMKQWCSSFFLSRQVVEGCGSGGKSGLCACFNRHTAEAVRGFAAVRSALITTACEARRRAMQCRNRLQGTHRWSACCVRQLTQTALDTLSRTSGKFNGQDSYLSEVDSVHWEIHLDSESLPSCGGNVVCPRFTLMTHRHFDVAVNATLWQRGARGCEGEESCERRYFGHAPVSIPEAEEHDSGVCQQVSLAVVQPVCHAPKLQPLAVFYMVRRTRTSGCWKSRAPPAISESQRLFRGENM